MAQSKRKKIWIIGGIKGENVSAKLPLKVNEQEFSQTDERYQVMFKKCFKYQATETYKAQFGT